MRLSIESLRRTIEARYLGFSPNSGSVKPVHLANGLFRTLTGTTVPTDMLNRFVGGTDDVLAPGLSTEQALRLRPLVQQVVAADGAVFGGEMASYTAGNVRFLTKDTIAQDSGALVAVWLKAVVPELADYLLTLLYDDTDPISRLCAPLLSQERFRLTPIPSHTAWIRQFQQPSEHWRGMVSATRTLATHLLAAPPTLLTLRRTVAFASLLVLRFLALLEQTYLSNTPACPWLLTVDATNTRTSYPAAMQASVRIQQSIVRFYQWAFARALADQVPSRAEMLALDPPLYREHDTETDRTAETNLARERWDLARQTAATSDEPYSAFGAALYDMLVLYATASPVAYFRRLGLAAGWLYPPNQSQPRLQPQMDMLELLVQSCLTPGERVPLEIFQDRLATHWGIVIGGRAADERTLTAHAVYVDRDALRANRLAVTRVLESLGCATALADGLWYIQSV